MNPLSQFTVLIERRALKQLLKLMTVLGMVFSLLTGQLAVAAPSNGNRSAVGAWSLPADLPPGGWRWADDTAA